MPIVDSLSFTSADGGGMKYDLSLTHSATPGTSDTPEICPELREASLSSKLLFLSSKGERVSRYLDH